MSKKSLIKGSPFYDYTPPPFDEWIMGMVYETARKSKDPSTKIGTVIVRDGHPILFGYNGIAQRVKDLPSRMVRPIKYKWTEHSERNALYCGTKMGISAKGTTLYTQAMPCVDCARGIINAGIVKVVIHKQTQNLYKKLPQWALDCKITKQMFKEAGVKLVTLDKMLGKFSFINEKVHIV